MQLWSAPRSSPGRLPGNRVLGLWWLPLSRSWWARRGALRGEAASLGLSERREMPGMLVIFFFKWFPGKYSEQI